MGKKGVDVRAMAKDVRDLNRMAADSEVAGDRAAAAEADVWSGYLQKFSLYETTSKFYMIGTDKSRRIWRVLTIDRLEPCELNIHEDPTIYSKIECYDLLKRIHDGNRSTGGLKFVTKCYGIVGFVKFVGPYYMLLITRRRKIGTICGHVVYAVSKSELITLPHSTVRSNMAYSKDENRYKRLLCMVDLTKDFFFSYSYNIMCSLQRNACDGETEQVLYETMFVWNEFLTHGIRNHLKNTTWTVALVYGFFKQAKLSISDKDFRLTLIARRSRHFAGPRYLKRGINEKGRVANDVEIEQIVFEDVPGKVPSQITSVVQNRGSIPLFWSQETSRLNIRPDIILKKDQSYEATRLHFDNLVERYGNPITILNLIKTCEKKPRESLLRAEFAHAIDYINKDLSEENFLRFLHWDLQKDYRRKGTDVLALLCNVAACVLDLTGFFYCLVTPALTIQGASKWPIIVKDNDDDRPCNIYDSRAEGVVKCENGSSEGKTENPDISGKPPADESKRDGSYLGKLSIFQKGVLRTNCIDCLDRTNVAQYAYGLVALGHQLCSLGFIDAPRIDLDAPLADDLMAFYERMGDTLALQYGGSAAHNKIFSERRGQWKAATQSQELLRTLQRYYSNMYMDAEKQDAINVFLGHYQPQQGKPALWELDSDHHYNVGRLGHAFAGENARSFINRSQSDGAILCESSTPLSTCSAEQKELLNSALPPRRRKCGNGERLCDSMPQISTCESNMPYSGYTPVMSHKKHSVDSGHGSNFSNFLDLDRLSSSGNLCGEETSKRSAPANSSIENLSTDNVMNGVNTETSSTEEGAGVKGRKETNRTLTIDAAGSSSISNEFTDSFVQWVANGGTFCY